MAMNWLVLFNIKITSFKEKKNLLDCSTLSPKRSMIKLIDYQSQTFNNFIENGAMVLK